MASPQIQVPVDEETRDRIFDIARAEGISMAQVCRDIVKKGLAAREKLSQRRTS